MTLELEREQAVQALCAHYAQSHLTTGELETRFERVYAAADPAQLRSLLADLPALPALVPVQPPLYQLAAGQATGLPAEKRYLAIFSEVKKEGAWRPAPVIASQVICGALVLDLREAELPPEGIVVDVDVIMGEARVLLPPGVGADVDASAIMGSVEDKAQRALPGAPVVRVRGSTFMGSIVVQTKLPKPARMEGWRKQLKAFFGGDGSGGMF